MARRVTKSPDLWTELGGDGLPPVQQLLVREIVAVQARREEADREVLDAEAAGDVELKRKWAVVAASHGNTLRAMIADYNRMRDDAVAPSSSVVDDLMERRQRRVSGTA